MSIIESLLDPVQLADYASYYETMLALAGVLLGLTFTALIFIVQSGFSSFKFSRRMFVEYYVRYGNNLLVSLGYLVIISVSARYLRPYPVALSIVFYLFACFFLKTLLDFYKHLGYLHTIFQSGKAVPSSFGAVRSYFRYIRNLGLLRNVILACTLAVFLVYPVVLSYHETSSFLITPKAAFYSTLCVLLFSVYKLIRFIPEYFRYTTLELERDSLSSEDSSETDETEIDYTGEKRALKQFLLSRGVEELRPGNTRNFIGGELDLHLLEKRAGPEARFNVHVSVESSSVVKIRDGVFRYAYRLLALIQESMVDINSFVVSFHVKVNDELESRNLLFRTNRREMEKILTIDKNPIDAIMEIENKLIDELFRDLQS